MRRTAVQWAAILAACGVRQATANRWGPIFADEVRHGTFSKGDADLADFLPNILHESAMLERLVESLDYAADRLVAVFGPSRISPARAQEIGRTSRHPADQPAIANQVYGGDWGRKQLGNIAGDDGWRYRGRSPIQLTGRANYRRVGDLMGQNLEGLPELLEQPRYALDACIAWWEDRIPDSMLGETTAVRQRVNGGTLGLEEVKALTIKARAALAANGG